MAMTETEGVEDGNVEGVVEVIEVGLAATLPVATREEEGVREGIGGLEPVKMVEGDMVRLGDTDTVTELEMVGVLQAEGFTEIPVVPQAAGQVQGMGAPDPVGQ